MDKGDSALALKGIDCPKSDSEVVTDSISRTQLQSEHATLSFLVCSIYNKLYKRLLKVEHSLGQGYYMMDYEYQPITEEQSQMMNKTLGELLNSDVEIKMVRLDRSKLLQFFEAHGFHDKIGLLKIWQEDFIPCISCGEFLDYTIEPMSVNKSRLKISEIRSYENGVILRFPVLTSPLQLVPYSDPHKLFEMFREYREWAKLIDCDNVVKLNNLIYRRKIDDIKWIAEGLHAQKLAKIAKHLVKNYGKKRVVTIAGPSSSNKTTFALRLAIQLRVNGFNSIVVSMDDFYKNTAEILPGPDGLKDFEHINALNVELLSQRVHQLLQGGSVPHRRFDFTKGMGFDQPDHTFSLAQNTFLIIEGIHGLNPELLRGIGEDKVTPIYVSALTPLNIDFNHRFPTSDLRLIRRIIRDYRYRGYSPRKTIRRWTSVRMGEENNIFPYQGNAELFFNSALVYELPVLSVQGKALLAEATVPEADEDPESPYSIEVTKEARRLLGMLNLFYPVSIEVVPHISCIREFVGGSDLKY